MSRFLDLPVELHVHILKLLCYSMREASCTPEDRDRSDRNESTSGDEFKWLNAGGPASFPFNVATTCKLWRTILSTIPECWTRVDFDTSVSPSPFLDAFSFSADRKIMDVNIFFQSVARPYDSEEQDTVLEAARVSTIFNTLRPHLHRCMGSIAFGTEFPSSQPPPVTFFMDRTGALKMQEFTQWCVVENTYIIMDAIIPLSDPVKDVSLDCCKPGAGRPFLGSSLKKLTLTAYWFMHMLVHGHTASMFKMRSLPSRKHGLDSFRVDGHVFDEKGPFTLETFTTGLSEIVTSELFLSHLFFPNDATFPRPGLRRLRSLKIQADVIHFFCVSREIIQHLDHMAEIAPRRVLMFKRCAIPSKLHKNYTATLILQDVKDGEHQTTGRVELAAISSISSAIHWWNGHELMIFECPSFNDDVILRMQRAFSDGTLPASSMKILWIRDCQNFTPRALMHLIQARANPFLYPSPDVRPKMMDILIVEGNCPPLTEDDMEWFRNNTDMRVGWKVKGMPKETPFIRDSHSGRELANGYYCCWPHILQWLR